MKFGGLHSILEGLIPYTERHFQRLSRLLQVYICMECHFIFTGNNTLFAQLSMFVDYTWQCMKLPDQFSATGSEMMQTAKDTLSGSVMSGHSDVTIAVADSTTSGVCTAACVGVQALHCCINRVADCYIRAFQKGFIVKLAPILTLQMKYLYLWKTLILTRPYTRKL